MKNEDVIRLAKEANGEETWPGGVDWTWEELQTFTKLVVEHERGACAKIADEWAVGWPHPSKRIAELIRGQS